MKWMRSLPSAWAFLTVAQAQAQAADSSEVDDSNVPCDSYGYIAEAPRAPFTNGVHKLSSMRPPKHCRSFRVKEVDEAIETTAAHITDPDLARLFSNTFPNTLDTTVAWRGVSEQNSEEELAFIITGDIPAMWLRDSAQQLQSYAPLLHQSSSNDSLASLYRGVINLQARYLAINPYCQAFQPPKESGRSPERNWAYNGQYKVTPPYDRRTVFECDWELDSHAAFLQLSSTYYRQTNDLDFFGRFSWVSTIESILEVAENMTEQTTYEADGTAKNSSYLHTSFMNGGLGSPLRHTGLIKVFFRPSDDATMYQFFIPGNMQFSHYLNASAEIMERLPGDDKKALAKRMRNKATSVRQAIEKHGIVSTKQHGEVYAYEVDGYGGVNLMDDANSPSLLSSAYFGYNQKDDPVYQNTRARILSTFNPYWAHGTQLSTVGSPHSGPVNGWPMAAIMRILTSDDDAEITQQIYQLISSTDGLGLIHESVNAHNESIWTRSWFAWANGLFGQAIYELKERKPHILKQSFQDITRSKDDVGNLQYSPRQAHLAKESSIPQVASHQISEDHEHPHDDSETEHMTAELHLDENDMTWFWFVAGGLIAASLALIVLVGRRRHLVVHKTGTSRLFSKHLQHHHSTTMQHKLS